MVAGGDLRWQVSQRRQGDHTSRYVVAVDITTQDLLPYIVLALKTKYPFSSGAAAVMVERMDQTPEAKRARFDSEFYSTILYKDGRTGKRRKYKKTQTEKEWEEFFASQKRELLNKRKEQNDIYNRV